MAFVAALACLTACSDSGPASFASEMKAASIDAGDGSTVLFHDYSGNTEDESQYGHDGTAFGEPGFPPICDGHAIQFDGLDDYVRVENSSVLQPSAVTVEVRFRPASTLG